MADQLNQSTASPSGDLRFVLTLTRTADDVDPKTGLATDYANCQVDMVFVRNASGPPVVLLSVGDGFERVTNSANLQVLVGAISQPIVQENKGRQLAYRLTITTSSGAKVSGGNKKPGYSGSFTIGSF